MALTLIGPNQPAELTKLLKTQKLLDPHSQWLEYLGALAYKSLDLEYQRADMGVFASRCETFGMTVLEKMSVGLPIACSGESSMQEVLGDAGVYFDPQSPQSIASAIEHYLVSADLRLQKQALAHLYAQQYTWQHCAKQTIDFFREVIAQK